jgi:hypothetical protein
MGCGGVDHNCDARNVYLLVREVMSDFVTSYRPMSFVISLLFPNFVRFWLVIWPRDIRANSALFVLEFDREKSSYSKALFYRFERCSTSYTRTPPRDLQARCSIRLRRGSTFIELAQKVRSIQPELSTNGMYISIRCVRLGVDSIWKIRF